MIDFQRFLPEDESVAVALPPEELAAPLLEALRHSREPIELNAPVTLPKGMYPQHRREVLLSLAEAFAYLKHEGLVVPYPPELHNLANKDRRLYIVSRAGKALELPAGLESYRHSRLLPPALLHPKLLGTVLPLYLRRDYETAVFAAMKEVELAVHEASALPPGLVGTALMRKAFGADQLLGSGFTVDSERQALSDLFAGAMGYFRNTTGHRVVDFKSQEAARVLLFAAELIGLVDQRRAGLISAV